MDCNFTITAIMVIAHFDTSSPKVSFADFTAAAVGSNNCQASESSYS